MDKIKKEQLENETEEQNIKDKRKKEIELKINEIYDTFIKDIIKLIDMMKTIHT